MAITEESRHHVLVALDARIGKDAAMTLAEHLPPVGWADVATKSDLVRLTSDLAVLRTDLASLEVRLEQRIGAEADRTRAEVIDRINSLLRWMTGFLATMLIAAVSLAVGTG